MISKLFRRKENWRALRSDLQIDLGTTCFVF